MLVESHEFGTFEEDKLFPLNPTEKSSTSPRDYSPTDEMYNTLIGDEGEDADLLKIFACSNRSKSPILDTSCRSCLEDNYMEVEVTGLHDPSPFFQPINRARINEQILQKEGISEIIGGLKITKPVDLELDNDKTKDHSVLNCDVKDKHKQPQQRTICHDATFIPEPSTPPSLHKRGKGSLHQIGGQDRVTSLPVNITPAPPVHRQPMAAAAASEFQGDDIDTDKSLFQYLEDIIARKRMEIVSLQDAKIKEEDFLPLTDELIPWLLKSYQSWNDGSSTESVKPPPKKKSKSPTPMELKPPPKNTNADTDGKIFVESCRELLPKVFMALKGKDATILLQKVMRNEAERKKVFAPIFECYMKIYDIATKKGKKQYNLKYTKRTPLITGLVQMFIMVCIIFHKDNIMKYPDFIEFEVKFHQLLEEIKTDPIYLQHIHMEQYDEALNFLQYEKFQLYQDANLKFLLMLILPASHNKHWIIEDICPRLLSFQKVSLGSGKKPPTIRREKLFEQENKEWRESLLRLSSVNDRRIKELISAKHDSKDISTNLSKFLSFVDDGASINGTYTARDASKVSASSDNINIARRVITRDISTRRRCVVSSTTSCSPTTIIADIEEATAAADRMMIAPTPSNEIVLENITGNTRHYSARSDGSNSVCSSMDSAGSLLDPDFDIYSEDWSSKGTSCVDIMNAPKKNDEVNKENINNRELVRTVSHGSTASSVSYDSHKDDNMCCHFEMEVDMDLFAYIK